MSYWVVLPYYAVQHMTHLKLAPAGVVLQQEWHPHPIMDYSFNAVNQQSLPLAPLHVMQFRHAFQCILQCLVHANPCFGPTLLAKVDLAEGYYRISLAPKVALEFATVLPPDPGSDPFIGIPLSLPMGWVQSPLYFCTFNETGTNIANTLMPHPMLKPHPLKACVQLESIPTNATNASMAVLPI